MFIKKDAGIQLGKILTFKIDVSCTLFYSLCLERWLKNSAKPSETHNELILF